MVLLLSVAVAVLLIATIILAYQVIRYKRRRLQETGRDPGWPVPTVSLAEFHPAFAPDEFGPTLRTEVLFIGQAGAVAFGTTDVEAWILAVLGKESRDMFEFGTATGKTSYLWARNSAPEARITTLTLAPEQVEHYQPARGDTRRSRTRAVMESTYSRFRYTGTGVEQKVTQLFGDSKEFDETPYLGRFDLIFVDGSHAYSYVESDTEKALRMLAPGGIILWHDYKAWDRAARGVFRYLNELKRRLPLVHLKGTTLVAYRAEGAPPPAARAAAGERAPAGERVAERG